MANIVIQGEELYHFGILGQKWGIRRYQNPDGTLTAEGFRRYQNKFYSKDKYGVDRLNSKAKKLSGELNDLKFNKHRDIIDKYDEMSKNVVNEKEYQKYLKETRKNGDLWAKTWNNRNSKEYMEARKKYEESDYKRQLVLTRRVQEIAAQYVQEMGDVLVKDLKLDSKSLLARDFVNDLMFVNYNPMHDIDDHDGEAYRITYDDLEEKARFAEDRHNLSYNHDPYIKSVYSSSKSFSPDGIKAKIASGLDKLIKK